MLLGSSCSKARASPGTSRYYVVNSLHLPIPTHQDLSLSVVGCSFLYFHRAVTIFQGEITPHPTFLLIGPLGEDSTRSSQNFEGLYGSEDGLARKVASCLRGLLPALRALRDLALVENEDLMQPLLSSAGRGHPHSQAAPCHVMLAEC